MKHSYGGMSNVELRNSHFGVRTSYFALRAVALLYLGIMSLVQLRCDKSGPRYEYFRVDSLNAPVESDLRYEYFIVKVDSLNAPDSLPHTDTLKVRLFGTIGYWSYYRLARIAAERADHEIDLTVWGKYPTNAYARLPMVIGLRERYDIYPVVKGVFRIRVHQPDSLVLSDSTIVF